MMAKSVVEFVRSELAAHADPRIAHEMAAYMKTNMPFYGVQQPARAVILRQIKERFAIESAKEYRESVLALWNQPHREEKYLAIALARMHTRFITIGMLPRYRRLIVEGAWWDLVDDVAINLVGIAARPAESRERAFRTIDSWIDHRDMWLRRTAIICQIKHKQHTDEARLFEYCLKRAHEKEFFIRKAIGWALREHSKTAPGAVRRFLAKNGDRLSPLSLREAAKRLNQPQMNADERR